MPEEKRENKICSVCGDQALGYNFNAVTCESCKAFFRRNAIKEKTLRCPFRGCCDITCVTRRFCQSCRLDKCLRVGMKRELIMSEEDKERKRRKRHDASSGAEATGGLLSKRALFSGEVQTLLVQDAAVQTDEMFSIILPPTPASSPRLIFGCDGDGTPLSSADKVLLNDLLSAMKTLDTPIDKEMSELPRDDFTSCGSDCLLDVINLTAIVIRRLIQMCKKITGFRALPQSDQLSLLKQGCTQMMLLRSVANYDPDRDSWRIPHSKDSLSRIKLEVLKEVKGDLYEVHEAWLRRFDSRISRDIRVISLLTVIALFDPSRNNLTSASSILSVQGRYQEVLVKYLESLFLAEDASQIYSHLLDQMEELRRLNEDHVRVYLNVDPTHIEPLLLEIFDIKTH